jgi:DDE superfamily endonuclease
MALRPQRGSVGRYPDAQMLLARSRHVLGDDGILTLDGSDSLKKGKESVGMKRQYRGAVGKHAHRQAGIFLGYASRYGSTLLDRRLYLSQEWIEDGAYAAWPAGSARRLQGVRSRGYWHNNAVGILIRALAPPDPGSRADAREPGLWAAGVVVAPAVKARLLAIRVPSPRGIEL